MSFSTCHSRLLAQRKAGFATVFAEQVDDPSGQPEVWIYRKANPMSFVAYYSRLLAQRKAGFPTVDEAKRDYRDALASLIRAHYG